MSTADLSVSLDATGVLAAISSLGAVHVRCGILVFIVLILLVNTHALLHKYFKYFCVCVQSGPSGLNGVFLREIQGRWK